MHQVAGHRFAGAGYAGEAGCIDGLDDLFGAQTEPVPADPESGDFHRVVAARVVVHAIEQRREAIQAIEAEGLVVLDPAHERAQALRLDAVIDEPSFPPLGREARLAELRQVL